MARGDIPRPPMEISPELAKKLDELCTAYLDAHGREVVNPKAAFLEVTPVRLSLREQIQRCLRTELSMQAMQQGRESFEESQDFDVQDPFDMPLTASAEMQEESPEVFSMPTDQEVQDVLDAQRTQDIEPGVSDAPADPGGPAGDDPGASDAGGQGT